MNVGQFVVLNVVGVTFGYLVKVRGDHNGDNGNLFMLIIIIGFFVTSLIIFLVKFFKALKKHKSISKPKE